ncbi:EAL domain-containing protein [Cognatiyoonia sp. IB215182]|uniref:sensor domain-containing protein n=1 Tax=Cognatiyoonia sp. IB215182 TaxID=3097353 RepID=UPI002A10AC9B|nr:EAL domain-containing protein [Cognatiyoonia sp. IB215182]MDX8354319.1 EAL domain-containing protein [Cognatiyoonia sp. IB215182]
MKERRSRASKEPSDLGKLANTERFVAASLSAANVAMWNICPETGETWFSDEWYTNLGYEVGAFTPSFDVFLEMMHPDDRPQTVAAFQAHVDGRTEVYRADFRLRCANGSWRWIGASGAKTERAREGLPYLICGMQLDISWRKEAEQELARAAREAEEAKERLTVLANNSPASLFEFRICADGSVTFPYITAGVLELLAVEEQDVNLDGAEIFRNIHEDDLPDVQAAIDLSMRELSPFHQRYRVKLKGGGVRWIRANSLPKRLEDGGTTWFGSIYDVTKEVEREDALASARDAALALEAQMRELALVDGLTGLPNRRSFDTHIKVRQSESPKVSGTPAAVLIRVDLDRFKNVNDTLGHEAGDAVLCHVSNLLREATACNGLAARTGGDEFSIVLRNGLSVEDAKGVVGKIQTGLRDPFLFEGKICRFGASFGIATTENGSIGSGDLMSFADAALYRAKQRGRNRLEVFDNSLHRSIIDARRLAGQIEAGIEKKEFVPFFQPQVCAKTGELTGLEVLARWQSNDHGLLTPNRFLPVAEQIRVASLIDRAMVEGVNQLVADWQSKGFHPEKLSFNVSAERLQESDIVAAVKGLQQAGVTVSFELLESILLEEQDEPVRLNLDLMKDNGIQIEVDDFGSGHASILGLLEIKPDTLKIDTRLTQNVVEDAASRDLIGSVVGIARTLGIKTIAEGVETQSQMNILKDLGCDQIQGYLLSEPMSADDVLSWVIAYDEMKAYRSA